MKRLPVLLSMLFAFHAFGQAEPIGNVIDRFGTGSIADIQKDYRLLAKDPSRAVELLVKSLEPVREERYVIADERLKVKMIPKPEKMIWCLRALRALTGEFFFASTSYNFKDKGDDQIRHSVLTSKTKRSSQDVTFFGYRMSVGVFYFAPVDAQEKIIKAWSEWANKNLGCEFVPRSNELKW